MPVIVMMSVIVPTPFLVPMNVIVRMAFVCSDACSSCSDGLLLFRWLVVVLMHVLVPMACYCSEACSVFDACFRLWF